MIIERPLLVLAAVLAVGMSVAAAAVPTVERSGAAQPVETSAGGLQVAFADDELSWHRVNSSRHDPFDPNGPSDWITRGDPGSQDTSYRDDHSQSYSRAQDDDDDDHGPPPCLC